MDESDFEISLEEMFKAQMAMDDKPENSEPKSDEDINIQKKLIALIVKPHGFKTPPMKVVAAHLQKVAVCKRSKYNAK